MLEYYYEDNNPDEVEEIMVVFPIRRERVLKDRIDHFNIHSDFEFLKRFRITKESVVELLSRIGGFIRPPTERNNAVSAMNRLLLTLRFYATGNMLICVADFTGVSLSSASDFVWLVTRAICTLRETFIQMPVGPQKIREKQLQFYEIARFPGVIGAIDCTHVRMQSPGGDQAETYRNRKGYFSYNVQTISGPDLKIMDIVARWPGSSHDLTIFNNSNVRFRLERGEYGNGVILGDAGYDTNRNYLLTPLPQTRTRPEELYNESQIRTRNVVERQYGVWKRRFQVLRLEMRIQRLRIMGVIVATAIIHNIAIDMGDQVPPPSEDEQRDPVFDHDEVHEPGANLRRDRLIREYFSNL